VSVRFQWSFCLFFLFWCVFFCFGTPALEQENTGGDRNTQMCVPMCVPYLNRKPQEGDFRLVSDERQVVIY
jgi:hypothetical protein